MSESESLKSRESDTSVRRELWVRTKAIVGEALEMPRDRREEFVLRACDGMEALLGEVRELLAASETHPGELGESGLPDSVLSDLAEGCGVTVGSSVGKYQIVRHLGSGGMGSVFEAVDTTLGRTVALKLLSIGLASTGARRRFEGEAQALARLDHPGIARVLEAGVHRAAGDALSVPYFAMEFVPNARRLDAYVAQERLNVAAVLRLFADVCDAVHHGHQKGVLHRDLKPSNILIGDSGCPKVIDFGVSRLIDAGGGTHATVAGEMVGTPAYLPPEAFAKGVTSLDTRADVYALGVVLYELLAGRRPYDGAGLTPLQIGRLVCDGRVVPIESVRTECAGDVSTIIAKAMNAEPDHRYASAEQFGADVRRVLAFEPILARRVSWLRLTLLFARRNRVLVVAGTAAGVALAVGVIGLSVGLARARESERRARAEALQATQVSAFIMNMLRSANPFSGEAFRGQLSIDPNWMTADRWPSVARPGTAPTIGDMLFGATERLAESFPDNPRLQADLAAALAQTGSAISDPRHAELALRAEQLLERAYGVDDVRTMTARQYRYMAALLKGSPRYLDEATKDLRVVLSKPLRAGPLLTWAWSNYLASMEAGGRGEEALTLLAEVRERIEREIPGESRDRVLLDLAVLRVRTLNRDPRAGLAGVEPLLRRATVVDGGTGTTVAAVLFAKHYFQRALRDYEGALATLAEGAAISTRVYGGLDQHTYEWWNNIGYIAILIGDYARAEHASREQARGANAMLGPHSTHTMKANGRVARCLLGRGERSPEAERWARMALEGAQDDLQRGDDWALYHEVLLAWAIRVQGDAERAERLLRDRMAAEAASGRSNAVNWVEIMRWTELAQCAMDRAELAGDVGVRRADIDRMLREAECYADEVGPDWPSVRLVEQARARWELLSLIVR